MLRFANILEQELTKRNLLYARIEPKPFFGSWAYKSPFLAKWGGYFDKFFLFPFILKSILRKAPASPPLLIHICDHSNALYAYLLQKRAHLVTCNDLIAIKSALGQTPEYKTGLIGKILQRIILKSLKKAKNITCISQKSLQDLLEVASVNKGITSCIYMGLNYPYRPLSKESAGKRVQDLFPRLHCPYILHVGSNAWYKNKQGLLYLFKELQMLQKGKVALVLVGPLPPPTLCQWIKKNNLEELIHFAPHISNEDLRALYAHAKLLLYPSLYEGFGWPILEAQACGCPVVATEIAPLTEIGGSAASYIPSVQSMKDRNSWAQISVEVISWQLNQPAQEREKQIKAGLENSKRFSTEAMVESYCKRYKDIVAHFTAESTLTR